MPDVTSASDWVTSTEAAAILGYGRTHVNRLVRMGKLAGLQDNGRVFVSRSSLEAVAATQAEWISIVTAAGIAGVGTKVIQGALARGEITQREGPTAHPSISRSSLEDWARTYEPLRPKPRPRPMSLPPDDEHDWVGPDVVAERLGLTQSRVRQLARAERLPMVQRGARWWMTAEHLDLVATARAHPSNLDSCTEP